MNDDRTPTHSMNVLQASCDQKDNYYCASGQEKEREIKTSKHNHKHAYSIPIDCSSFFSVDPL